MSHMSKEATDAGIEVKVEPFDGSYACGFCSESVRGTAALKCSQCSSNPAMEVWTGAGAGAAAPSEIIDLRDQEGEGRGATEVATAARARGARIMAQQGLAEEAAGEGAAAGGAGEAAARGAQVAQAAEAKRKSREEGAAVSGKHKTETREVAAGE